MAGQQTATKPDPNGTEQTVVLDLEDSRLAEAMTKLSPEELDGAGLSALTGQQAKTGDDAHKGPDPSGAPNADPAPQGLQPDADPAGTKQPSEADQLAGDVPMIPKPRFDEVNEAHKATQTALNQANKLLTEQGQTLSYLAGQVEILKTTAAQQPGNAGPTPEQQIAEIDQQSATLQKQFDDGEITAKDLIVKNNELQQSRMQIQMDAERAKFEAALSQSHQQLQQQQQQSQPTQQQQQTEQRDAFVERETDRIEAEHPHLQFIPDAYTPALFQAARASLDAQGVQYRLAQDPKTGEIKAADTDSLLRLREAMGHAADRLGPGITGMTAEQAKAKLAEGNQQAAASQQQPNAGGQAQARAEKLALQASMPPDITGSGSPAPKQGLTEGQFVALANKDFASLENLAPETVAGILRT